MFKNFFATNPELNVQESLTSLVSHYPDTESWVLDSGVAVQLLIGQRETIPTDLDVVCRDDEMESDFGHTHGLDPNDNRYIDVKSIRHWLSGRVDDINEQSVWSGIIASSSETEVGGVKVKIIHPAIIAAGKSTLARMSPRPKDATDIVLLNVSPEQLAAATELLRGHDIDTQVKLLT